VLFFVQEDHDPLALINRPGSLHTLLNGCDGFVLIRNQQPAGQGDTLGPRVKVRR
jgi:hypothetical protein